MTKQLLALAAAAGFLASIGTAALAQTPGQQMQEKGSLKDHPGASGYAPGIQMQEKGSVKGTTGASGYAPDHATTGASVKGSAGVKAGGAKANTDIDATGNARVK